MIKKIFTFLFVLLVLAVLGITALLFWVNPNHYKSFISDAVKEKTGYELTISGDLHWHIWPKVSLLSEGVKLQDASLKKPLLIADNMRFDVELWPLFSKKLVITDVFVKSATVTLTDETSRLNQPKSGVTTPSLEVASPTVSSSTSASPTVAKNEFDQLLQKVSWLSDLNQLRIVDSVVVYQSQQGLINFRDIHLTATQQKQGVLSVDFKGRINRNQRDLSYHLVTALEMHHDDQLVSLPIEKLRVIANGKGLPIKGVDALFIGTLNYYPTTQKLESPDAKLTLNENQLSGKLGVNLGAHPVYDVNLSTDHFSLLAFGDSQKTTQQADSSHQQPAEQRGGGEQIVINQPSSHPLAFLQDFDANFVFKAKKVTTPKIILHDVWMEGQNRAGLLTMNKMQANMAEGDIHIRGQADSRHKQPRVDFSFQADRLNAETLLTTFGLEKKVSGRLTATGQFSTRSLSSQRFLSNLTGDLALTLQPVVFNHINLEGLIESAARISGQRPDDKTVQHYTEFHQLSTEGHLAGGVFKMKKLAADSASLNVAGLGQLNLLKKTVDLSLTAKILKGWNEKSETIRQLQKLAIPIRIYGALDQLHYDLNIEKLLQSQVTSQLKDKVNKELDRFFDKLDKKSSSEEASKDKSKDKKEVLRDQIKEGLQGFLDKL